VNVFGWVKSRAERKRGLFKQDRRLEKGQRIEGRDGDSNILLSGGLQREFRAAQEWRGTSPPVGGSTPSVLTKRRWGVR